ncbi:hypothetical protein OKW41_001124 [Paraburkholderia sp. UCT70]|uniref:TniQ family protein n=1 Tax=Paraburkholderia sp. UCT70 TaxID=2991068 RepID=UPI003D1B69D4
MNDWRLSPSKRSWVASVVERPIGVGKAHSDFVKADVRWRLFVNVSEAIVSRRTTSDRRPAAFGRHYPMAAREWMSLANSKGKLAEMWVDSLNRMVGRSDLKFLTLLPWAQRFGPFARLMNENRQWCALCLEEDLQSGSTINERLIWSVQWVKICERHRCRLTDACPTCGYRQPSQISPRQLCGFCSRCEGWLGAANAQPLLPRQTTALRYEEWAAKCSADLVARAPPSTRIDARRCISQVIERGISRYFDGDAAAFCEHIGVSKSCPQNWRTAGPPHASTLMAISYCLQVPLHELVEGVDAFKRSRPLPLPSQLTRKHIRAIARPIDWEQVEQFLTEVANGILDFDSLTSALEAIHLQPTRAYAHFPNLCRHVTKNTKAKRKEAIQGAREERRSRLDNAIFHKATRMISGGERPTIDKLLRFAQSHGPIWTPPGLPDRSRCDLEARYRLQTYIRPFMQAEACGP